MGAPGLDFETWEPGNGATQEYFYFGGKLLSVHNLQTGVWSDHIYGAGGGYMATATAAPGSRK